MRAARPVMVIVALAVCGVIVWVAYARAHRSDVGAHGGAPLHVSGMVEATTVDVAPEIAGTIIQLLVDEGETVQRGQLVVRLDGAMRQERLAAAEAQAGQAAANLAKLRHGSRPQEIAAAERRVGEAQAAAQAAKAQLDKLQAGLRPQEIEEARARAGRARSEAEQASRDWRRMRELAEQGAVSTQAAEAARTAAESARAQAEVARQQLSLARQGARAEDILAAQAQLRRAQEALGAARAQASLVREGPRREDVEAARAQQRAAQAAAREARVALDQTKLYAPLAAVVQTKIAEAGDTVSSGSPVVRLINPDDVWLTVYVPETAIGRVRVGQPVRVTLDSYPGRDFRGAVKSISSEAEFTPKYVQTPDERTRLVYAVKVRLDNRQRIFKPGMPADAVITLRGDGGTP